MTRSARSGCIARHHRGKECTLLPFTSGGASVDTIAHIIQVALTPVFLLSGIGTLLNVFNTRLARVSDHTEHATELLKNCPEDVDAGQMRRHLLRLMRRRSALDLAIGLGAAGGVATCGAAVALFIGVLREEGEGAILFFLFGVALGCTIGALLAFVGDTVLAWHGVQRDGALPHVSKRP